MQGLQFTLAGSDLFKGQIVNFKGQGDIAKTLSCDFLCKHIVLQIAFLKLV